MDSNALYLDHAATTPVRSEVVEAMLPCLSATFGNPSSRHGWGRAARRILEDARDRVASSLGCEGGSVYFVRGGTEGDNLAVLGRARRIRRDGGTPRIVTTAVEHPAVLEAAAQVAREGGVHMTIPLTPDGLDLDALRGALRDGASLVSCMWVNNETGIRLPVEAVADLCREEGVPWHSDAVQAAGKVPLPLHDVAVDFLTLTGHKIHGPRGTGVLVARDPELLEPLHFGGGQEGAVRPGTEDVAGAVGFATALELAVREQPEESRRLTAMRDGLERRFLDWNPRLRVNGGHLPRAPHILSLGLDPVDIDALLAALDVAGLAVSVGSACASGSSRPSPTVTALYGAADTRPSLRLSLGRLVSADDEERIVATVADAYDRVLTLLAS